MARFQNSTIAVWATLFLALSSINLSAVNAANILGLFTAHSPSGLIVHMSVARALADAGHNVTVVSSLPSPIEHPNIRYFVLPPPEEVKKTRDGKIKELSSGGEESFVGRIKKGYDSLKFMLQNQAYILKDDNLMSHLKSPETSFDLVILGYFYNDYLLGVAALLDCPVILSWPAEPMELLNVYVGNPPEITYVPNMNIGARVGELMTFTQRFKNFFTNLALKALKFFKDYQHSALYNELFDCSQNKDFPTYGDMQKKVSLVFVNNHFSEGPVRPNVPALIEIAGIQLKTNLTQIPTDVKSSLETSKHGTILVSLGTNVRSDDLDQATAQSLFNVLSQLPQKVIWKWDNTTTVPGQSPNILFRNWVPQQEILAHDNLKFFITHAGKGSVVEAQYSGVPMLALPFFADQPGNANKLVSSGYGLKLDPYHLTEHDLKEAINDLLTNNTYSDNIQQFLSVFNDRPLSPSQAVVYWSEYVIKYSGALHMQSPLVHLNAIESNGIDVIIFLRLGMYLVYRILKFIIVFVYRKIRPAVKSKQD